jgi:hypothetical protein
MSPTAFAVTWVFVAPVSELARIDSSMWALNGLTWRAATRASATLLLAEFIGAEGAAEAAPADAAAEAGACGVVVRAGADEEAHAASVNARSATQAPDARTDRIRRLVSRCLVG